MKPSDMTLRRAPLMRRPVPGQEIEQFNRTVISGYCKKGEEYVFLSPVQGTIISVYLMCEKVKEDTPVKLALKKISAAGDNTFEFELKEQRHYQGTMMPLNIGDILKLSAEGEFLTGFHLAFVLRF